MAHRRRVSVPRLVLATTLVAAATTVQARALSDDGGEDPNSMRVFWKDSLRLETQSKKFKLRIGGRMHTDLLLSDEDSDLENGGLKIQDGVEMRRARLYVSGDVYENIEFKFQYDFASNESQSVSVNPITGSGTSNDGSPDFKDVYMGIKQLFGGGVRVGQFKEPLGLEQLTSSNSITFLERSLTDAIIPGRSTGLMYHAGIGEAGSEKMTVAVGAFRDADNRGNEQGDGNWVLTGRLTGVVYEGDGDQSGDLVHLGVGGSVRDVSADRLRARPEIHLGPRFVDTGNIAAEETVLMNVEAACVFGSFSAQGEYAMASIDGASGTSDFDGESWYLMASYLLTGEQRRYDRRAAVFKNPKPDESWNGLEGTGCGAWEVAARVSNIDLDDGGVNGGEMMNFTLGCNWYLNNNARVMFNLVRADLDQTGAAPDGDATAFVTRFQFAF